MMMFHSPKVLFRRLATVTVTARRPAATTFFRAMTTADPKKPNPEGPVLAGYPDYLDQMNAKAEKMEAKLEKYGSTVKWMDPADIDALMNLHKTHEKEMAEELKAMKMEIQAAKSNYAVDAPDGECDGHLEEEFEEVQHILEKRAEHKTA